MISTDDSTKVYSFKLEGAEEGATVQIDGKDVTLPKYHKDDTNYYLWLNGENHSVKVGEETKKYIFSNGEFLAEGTNEAIDISAGNIEIYDDYYSLGETRYSYDGAIKITGQSDTNTIKVKTTVNKQITLNGVNIESSVKSPFEITGSGTGAVTVILNGDNTLTSTAENFAGLQKTNTESKLIIRGEKADNSDSLTVTGGKSSAGIGGGRIKAGNNIEISGGNIIATGGSTGAGIGGGYYGVGSNIEISSGIVKATGGLQASGIGGGSCRAGSNIEIRGGSVDAAGGSQGAGIGGGYSAEGSNITISGGSVTAKGGFQAAAIGGGERGEGKNIYISGGSVKATAGSNANPIGGGTEKEAFTPLISPDDSTKVYLLKLEGAKEGEAIQIDTQNITLPQYHKDDTNYYLWLNGENHNVKVGKEIKKYVFLDGALLAEGTNEAIDISAGNIEIYDDYYSLGETRYNYDGAIKITGQSDKNTVKVNTTTDKQITLNSVSITNSIKSPFEIAGSGTGAVTVILKGENTLKTTASNFAGLQKTNTESKLIIKGEKADNSDSLIVTGGENAAGIGGGRNKEGNNIVISGGNITATGGSSGAGIGGGYYGVGSNIEVSGGSVTATGGNYGAGIGGGDRGNGSNIYISGGSVKAIAGKKANAIGGGYGNASVTPLLSAEDGREVYLYTLYAMGEGEVVKIDENEVTLPLYHQDDTLYYIYLTGETHSIVAESKDITIIFDSESKTFSKVIDENTIYGDADNDKAITVNDAKEVLKKVLDNCYVMPIENEYDNFIELLDVDVDKKLTATDSAAIMEKALNSDYKFVIEK